MSLRALVVDDERPVVDVVCEVLEDAGIAALGCTQAAEAYWYIRHKQPELVILDVQMPGVNGVELLRQLRADPHTARLPVIFVTANRHVVHRHVPNYPALGAMLLPKPFHVDELLALVAEALAARPVAGADRP